MLWPVVVKLFTEPVQLGLDAGASKEQISDITIERLNKFIRGYYGTPLHFKYASDLNEVVSKALYFPGSYSQVRFQQNQIVTRVDSRGRVSKLEEFGGTGGLRPDHVKPHFEKMTFDTDSNGQPTLLLPVDIGDTKGHTSSEFGPHDLTQTRTWLKKVGSIIEQHADGNHTFYSLFGLSYERVMAKIDRVNRTLVAKLKEKKLNLSDCRLRLQLGDKYHILLRNHEFFLDERGQVNPAAFQAILGLAPSDRKKLLIRITNAKGQTISLDLGNKDVIESLTEFSKNESPPTIQTKIRQFKTWLLGGTEPFSFTN